MIHAESQFIYWDRPIDSEVFLIVQFSISQQLFIFMRKKITEMSKNLIKYKSENNFVKLSK